MKVKKPKEPKLRYRVWREGQDGLMLKTNYAGAVEFRRAPAMAVFWVEQLKSPYVQLWVGDTDGCGGLPFGFASACIASAKNERVKT